jgi:hypothetical protein
VDEAIAFPLGFSIVNTDLVMFPDSESHLNSREELRTDLVTKIMKRLNVIIAVDEDPVWVTLYNEFNISERIAQRCVPPYAIVQGSALPFEKLKPIHHGTQD